MKKQYVNILNMSLELREGDFANSVASVAKELLGPKYFAARFLHLPLVDDYLPVLRENIEEANRTRKNDSSYPYFAVSGITDLANKNKDNVCGTRAPSWTVATLIASNDPDIAQTSDINLRLMFDISFGIAVNDFQSRKEQALRAAAYYKSPEEQKDALKAAREHEGIAKLYEAFQVKLRETISVAPASQRK
jgi:hypothetical protein